MATAAAFWNTARTPSYNLDEHSTYPTAPISSFNASIAFLSLMSRSFILSSSVCRKSVFVALFQSYYGLNLGLNVAEGVQKAAVCFHSNDI